MNKKYSLLRLTLLAIVLFVLAFASMRIMSYSPARGSKGGLFSLPSAKSDSRKTQIEQEHLAELKRLKTQEIWDDEVMSDELPSEEQRNPSDASSLLKSARSVSWQNYVPRTLEASALQNTAVYNENETFFTPIPHSDPDRLAARRNPPAQSHSDSYSAPSDVAQTPLLTDSRMEEKRAAMLSEYLKPNREIEAKLNRTLDSLASNIQDAVAKALMPKSKKAQNIEKYRHKTQGGTAAADPSNPFANMLSQVSSQGDTIVQNVTKAFGNKAGSEMAGLMNAFQQELSSAVNMPNATNAQIAAKVQEISQKYQGKINKLAEKQQYDKFVQDKVDQDNAQIQELSKFYKGDLLEELGGILAKARETELALSSQNLPEKEYWEAILKNNYQKQVDMREAIKHSGEPLDAFYKLLDEQERRNVKAALEAEQKGEVPSYARVETDVEKQAKQKTLNEEKKTIINQVADTYGGVAAEKIGDIYERYAAKMKELSEKPMSDAARRLEEMNVRQYFNDQISNVLKTPEMRQMAVVQGTNKVIKSIYEQNPAIARDPQVKAQFELQSRPVIEQAMSKIIDIQNNDKMSPEQKQTAISQIERDLEKALSGGGQEQAAY